MNIFNIRNKIFRFAGIGVLNTGTDFLIFNLLVFSFGVSILYAFSLWKTISSLIAATQSYFLHKYITFEDYINSLK